MDKIYNSHYISELSIEELRELLKEVKKIYNSDSKPALQNKSNFLIKLLENSYYSNFMDKLSSVYTDCRIEVVQRFLTNKI